MDSGIFSVPPVYSMPYVPVGWLNIIRCHIALASSMSGIWTLIVPLSIQSGRDGIIAELIFSVPNERAPLEYEMIVSISMSVLILSTRILRYPFILEIYFMSNFCFTSSLKTNCWRWILPISPDSVDLLLVYASACSPVKW